MGPAIYNNLRRHLIASYLTLKHGITSAKLSEIDTESLGQVLRKMPLQQRAVIVKMIHGWHPTNYFLHKQHRTEVSTCPRCKVYDKTKEHILTCPDEQATQERASRLTKWEIRMKHANTCPMLLHILLSKLNQYMHIKDCPQGQLPVH